MDKSTDEANRSQLSIICRTLKDAQVENHFLELLTLARCDAETIFNRVEMFLKEKGIDITRIRFGGMDGCSTMSGEHNGVRTSLKTQLLIFLYSLL